ncbi:MAG: folylpolyglutamate synthase/dihydrofolate synthase family protein [Pseudomonadota bacterium]
MHPVDAILARLLTLHPKLIDLSLGRIERLLTALGHPERRLPPVIHVAGTNGKGSTIAFIASLAAAHGLRVHCYTSPHLTRFNERIALSAGPGMPPQPIADAPLEACLSAAEIANHGAPITFFEITTAAAFIAFAEQPADLVLLETGLGGRVDATNVLPDPAVTVITPIGMDHMGFLGDSVAAIAGEKAGIIKPGCPLVLASQPDDAASVIRQRAHDLKAAILSPSADLAGAPSLAGQHQRDNARLAVAAFTQFMAQRGQPVQADKVISGLANAKWPGRLQPVTLAYRRGAGQPLERHAYLDGAHNPEGMRALMAAWDHLVPHGTPCDLVIGVMANKALGPMIAALGDRFSRIIAVPVPDTGAGLPADDLASALIDQASQSTRDEQVSIRTADDWQAAIEMLSPSQNQLLIAGSLYLNGAVLRNQNNQNQRLALVGA